MTREECYARLDELARLDPGRVLGVSIAAARWLVEQMLPSRLPTQIKSTMDGQVVLAWLSAQSGPRTVVISADGVF